MADKKYKIPVSIVATASKHIGFVFCDSIEEYNKLALELWTDLGGDGLRENISNDFEIAGDSDIQGVKEDDLTP